MLAQLTVYLYLVFGVFVITVMVVAELQKRVKHPLVFGLFLALLLPLAYFLLLW